MEQSKGKSGQADQGKEEKKRNRRQKETQEQKMEKVDIKSSEKVRLNAVFNQLCAYEEEPSSDEDSKEKLYKKQIEERANAKKMKKPTSTFVSQTMKKTQKKQTKKYKDEDEILDRAKQKGKDIDLAYVEDVLPEKMKYNLKYISKFSFVYDIKVCIDTVIGVLR